MRSVLVLLAVFITGGAAILGYFILTHSVNSNTIIAPTRNPTLPTIAYNCISHCSPRQNVFMDGYKQGATHAVSGHLYDKICSKDIRYCSSYQSGYAAGWDKYIWAAEHTCYRCV
jgi:hypothetical protein